MPPIGRAMVDPVRSIDFVARFAEAWDGRGRHVFLPPFEHQMLLLRAGLDLQLHRLGWNDLKPYQRQALLVSARHGIEFGRACAWSFGEGEGARL